MTDWQENKKYLFGFSLLEGVGPSRFGKIQKFFSSLETAWHCQEISTFSKAGLDEKTLLQMLPQKRNLQLEKEWEEKILQEKIGLLSQEDELYPLQLKEFSSAPFVLFYRGNPEILQNKQLAVVGSRRPTFYGQQVIEKILPALSRAGLTITSGMAQGIDSMAHQIALNENSPTIAVLGSGLARKILQKHPCFSLANKILEKGGLILSEYSPFQQANRATFPARNRIVAGLSLGTLVIEAGEKSGSLITANYALENNREVFAIPGNIFSPQSIGANKLIQQGAKVVGSPNDILEAFNFFPMAKKTSQKKTSLPLIWEDKLEEKIFSQLTLEPKYLDKIAQTLAISPAEIATKISLMEIKGLVKNIGGGRFIKTID